MATRVFEMLGNRLPVGFCAVLAMLVAGCASQPQIINAIIAVNKAFQVEYEEILAKDGSRVFPVKRAEAYDAVRVSMARLRMTVEAQDPALGYVNVFASAPLPLTAEEWREAAAADLPRMRDLVRPYAPLESLFINFEPEGLQSVVRGTVVEVPSGTEISFTAQMRETAPPKSGFPRREYLPPTAVRMALKKMWAEVEREVRATYRRP